MADLTKKLMLAAYDERVVARDEPMFLLNFFTNESRTAAATVDLDVIRQSRKVAVDVVRGSLAAGEYGGERSTAKEFKIPLYHERAAITQDMLDKRVPGVDPYQPYGRDQAFAYHALNAIGEMRGYIRREMERMAGEALESGVITLDATDSLDFKRVDATTVTPSTKWDNSGTPLEDIESLANTVYQRGKIRPNTLVFGSAAWQAFVTNSNVTTYLDNRRITAGAIAPSEVVQGAVFWGRVAIGSYDFDLYIYDDFYENSSGTNVPYITTDSVLMLTRGARYDKVFGGVQVLEKYRDAFMDVFGGIDAGGMMAGDFIPYVWDSGERMAHVVGVQSAPLVIPTAIDTIGTFTNVDT